MEQSIWMLVGSEKKTDSAENSGTLFLTKTTDGYQYIIADGNNIKVKEGKIPIFEAITKEAHEESLKTGTEYVDLCAVVLTIAKKEDVYLEYVDLIGLGSDLFSEIYENVAVAGTYLAQYNYSDKGGNYALVRAIDGKVISTFEFSGEAYESMCYMNIIAYEALEECEKDVMDKCAEEEENVIAQEQLASLTNIAFEKAYDRVNLTHRITDVKNCYKDIAKPDSSGLSYEDAEEIAKELIENYDATVAEYDQIKSLILSHLKEAS